MADVVPAYRADAHSVAGPAHDVSHDHHDHAHPTASASAWIPGFSLLRLSVGERLAGVCVLIALIWTGVAWAITP